MKNRTRLCSLLLAPLFLSGCFGTARVQQQASAQKRAFAPVAEASAPYAPRFAALKLRTFRTLPPFDANTFIVRRPGGEFVSDFYNTWIASPNDLIRTQTTRFLEESRLFSAVYDASSTTLPPLGLEGIVSELYLDFAGPKPAAVVTLRLLILDERTPSFNVLFSSEKSARVEFDAADSHAPAQAFGAALTQTLKALTQTLDSASLPANKSLP